MRVISGWCPKCGEDPPDSFPVEYVALKVQAIGQKDRAIGEVLQFTCTRCHYQWEKACADKGVVDNV